MDAQQRMLKRTSLIIWDAIKRNSVETIKAKLEDGFPINHEITDSHLTPLAFACTRSVNPEVFQAILAKNPDVNARSSGGRTALHFAALAGN